MTLKNWHMHVLCILYPVNFCEFKKKVKKRRIFQEFNRIQIAEEKKEKVLILL